LGFSTVSLGGWQAVVGKSRKQMIDEELEMLALITSLFQELLHPLINLNASVEILNGKIPAKAVSIVDEIENNSKELKKKVHYLYGNVRQVFNLKSPDDVVSHLHQNAVQWKKFESALSYSLEKLQQEINLGLTLANDDLNVVMKEIMFKSFEDYQNLAREIEGFQSEDLLKVIEMRRR